MLTQFVRGVATLCYLTVDNQPYQVSGAALQHLLRMSAETPRPLNQEAIARLQDAGALFEALPWPARTIGVS